MTLSQSGAPVQSRFPRQVGSYELLEPLGAGATATVYLARAIGASGPKRQVAIKLLHAELEAGEPSADLVSEAKLAARIRHPNVVGVIDVDTSAFGTYLVMEYVEGETLEWVRSTAATRDERVPDAIAFKILIDALSGLGAVHVLSDEHGAPLGVIHRDFSPYNILVGSNGVARLTDFGIAKIASRKGPTKTGLIKGRVAYMSPEQARGKPLDQRCDIWAAGVVAWELLAGKRLFAGDDEDAILLQIVTAAPPPLASLRPDLPAAVSDALAKALRLDPGERWSSANELRDALAAAAPEIAGADAVARYLRAFPAERSKERQRRSEQIEALRAKLRRLKHRKPELVEPAPREPSNKPKRRWLAPGLLLLIGAGAIALLLVQSRKPEALPEPAPAQSAALLAGEMGDARSSRCARVSVRANAPIKLLRVDSRAITIRKPASEIALSEELCEGSLIEARSEDGRHARALVPKAGADVQLEFSRAGSRTRPSARKASSARCSPAYYFDKDGIKRLKPECL